MTVALSNTPILETERLILRAPRQGDFPHFLAFATSDRSHFGGPLTPDLAWRSFCHLTGHWVHRGFGLFVLSAKTDPETPFGMVGPYYPEEWPEKEIGWMVWSAEAEGKGIAFEAARATRDFAYTTLGWPTAVSYIAHWNTRSIALAKRLGATLDPQATPVGEPPCLVFRHPSPKVAA
ncbi:MAG: N-acetyltransferase [Cereibacter sphaeroides]|uniref:N-acetyltransferase n=1 Tax=Cereibacter sphaeroides TaxID=1063 RepID=A0A2W5TLP1_CERSP|nr:MAG: N-acetyltransferase [Cereibacter sphaeroides]